AAPLSPGRRAPEPAAAPPQRRPAGAGGGARSGAGGGGAGGRDSGGPPAIRAGSGGGARGPGPGRQAHGALRRRHHQEGGGPVPEPRRSGSVKGSPNFRQTFESPSFGHNVRALPLSATFRRRCLYQAGVPAPGAAAIMTSTDCTCCRTATFAAELHRQFQRAAAFANSNTYRLLILIRQMVACEGYGGEESRRVRRIVHRP